MGKNMKFKQLDLFEETALNKLHRLEKWMSRLQRQMTCVTEDLMITRKAIERSKNKRPPSKEIQQLNMFENVI